MGDDELRAWDDDCVRIAMQESGASEAEVRRQFRAWDLELLDDLLPNGMSAVADDELELMTIAEVMELAHVKTKKPIKAAVARGELDEIELGPKTIRYVRSEVRAWIDRGRKRL